MEEIVLYGVVLLVLVARVYVVIAKEFMKIKRTKNNIKKFKTSKSKGNIIEISNSSTNILLKDILLSRLYFFGRYKYIKDKKTGKTKYAYAYITKRNIRKQERKSIAHIKLDGWRQNLDVSKQTYNRCHIIASILGGVDDKINLITATRKLNQLMILYENKIQKYVTKTGKRVIYKVTPVYAHKNTLCKGVLMEAYSVSDKGDGVKFNIFIFNKQDDIKINYKNGEYKSINTKKSKISTNSKK